MHIGCEIASQHLPFLITQTPLKGRTCIDDRTFGVEQQDDIVRILDDAFEALLALRDDAARIGQLLEGQQLFDQMLADDGVKVGQAHHLVSASTQIQPAIHIAMFIQDDASCMRKLPNNPLHISGGKISAILDKDKVRDPVKVLQLCHRYAQEAQNIAFQIDRHYLFKGVQRCCPFRNDQTVQDL